MAQTPGFHDLRDVAPWGRSYAEYLAMFELSPQDLAGRILDCGAGPASFTAEAHAQGQRVVACDPLYEYSSAQIRARFEAVYPVMIAGMQAEREGFVWTHMGSPEQVGARRRASLARFLADFCVGLGLTDIDLVANDTGGAISQVFATGHPELLHTLTLTNCETHKNVPPKVLLPAAWLAHLGLAARISPRLLRDVRRGRKRFYGLGYQDIEKLPVDLARFWLETQFATPELARQNQRIMTPLRARDLLAIEPALARLQVPTLIVWGTGDIFFRRKWAYWLRDIIPGASEVVELAGARIFFPDERAAELTAALRRHWDAHP